MTNLTSLPVVTQPLTTTDPDSKCRQRVYIVIAYVIFSVIFMAWVGLCPLTPLFRLDSASISHFTITNCSRVSFTFQTHLTTFNPNKKTTLHYYSIQARVLYKEYYTALSKTTVPSFEQGGLGSSGLVAGFASAGSFVDGVGSERDRSGDVKFSLSIECRVGHGGFKRVLWWPRTLWVRCPFAITFKGNGGEGRFIGGARMCGVVPSL